ncbi:hypothetical protein D021_1774A, partial [Vibrio parahaemolyticus 10296]|jgi:hypothetical protein
MTKP